MRVTRNVKRVTLEADGFVTRYALRVTPSRNLPPPTLLLPPPRGFTLIELLVAMAILIVVTASTTLIFRGITQAWRSGQLRTERYQQARLIIDLFARELSSCVVNARYPFIGNDAAQGAPLQAGSQYAELFFVGTIPGRAGLVERGYWVNERGELMCHDDEPADGDYLSTGTSELCGTGVRGLEATYFDGTAWLKTWDGRVGAAQAGRVPKAVRIALTIGNTKPEMFETVIDIPTS